MATIEDVAGHVIMRCEIAVYSMPEDQAEAAGLDPEGAENVAWLPRNMDLTVRRITDWGPWRENPDHTIVTFTDASSNVLRMAPDRFDNLYTNWMASRPHFPLMN